ncbi:MAG: HAD family phosphatase [Bacilli bacterium]|nr:HAD family phosphatase [Bacilli bacterium]
MIELLATDLDGTLFHPKRRTYLIPRRNKKLITDFVNRGGRVVLVSSRGDAFLERTRQRLGVPVDFIGSDGTLVQIDGKVVRENVFEVESCKKLLEELRRDYDPKMILISTRDHPNVLTRTDVSKVTNLFHFLWQMVQGAYREPFVRSDNFFYQELNKGTVRKMMILIGITKANQRRAKEITEVLQKRYPDFEFMWLNQFIEITPKGCSKASGLSFYLDYLGINHDNVAVVGDSGNDVPMFEEFYENSYCMKHAPEAIRSQAKNVVEYVSDLYPVLCPSEDDTPSEKEG